MQVLQQVAQVLAHDALDLLNGQEDLVVARAVACLRSWISALSISRMLHLRLCAMNSITSCGSSMPLPRRRSPVPTSGTSRCGTLRRTGGTFLTLPTVPLRPGYRKYQSKVRYSPAS